VEEQFGLQNPTARVKLRKGLLQELVFDLYAPNAYLGRKGLKDKAKIFA
jgi:hypothetical protein